MYGNEKKNKLDESDAQSRAGGSVHFGTRSFYKRIFCNKEYIYGGNSRYVYVFCLSSSAFNITCCNTANRSNGQVFLRFFVRVWKHG
jgi:hypothetical protein